MVDKALHPVSGDQESIASKGQGLTDKRTIDENIAYTPNTVKWTPIHGVYVRKTAKNNGGKQRPDTFEEGNFLVRSLLISVSVPTSRRQTNSASLWMPNFVPQFPETFRLMQMTESKLCSVWLVGYWRHELEPDIELCRDSRGALHHGM